MSIIQPIKYNVLKPEVDFDFDEEPRTITVTLGGEEYTATCSGITMKKEFDLVAFRFEKWKNEIDFTCSLRDKEGSFHSEKQPDLTRFLMDFAVIQTAYDTFFKDTNGYPYNNLTPESFTDYLESALRYFDYKDVSFSEDEKRKYSLMAVGALPTGIYHKSNFRSRFHSYNFEPDGQVSYEEDEVLNSSNRQFLVEELEKTKDYLTEDLDASYAITSEEGLSFEEALDFIEGDQDANGVTIYNGNVELKVTKDNHHIMGINLYGFNYKRDPIYTIQADNNIRKIALLSNIKEVFESFVNETVFVLNEKYDELKSNFEAIKNKREVYRSLDFFNDTT